MKHLAVNTAYVESIGKVDRANLLRAVQEEGQGTVLRVCFWRHH